MIIVCVWRMMIWVLKLLPAKAGGILRQYPKPGYAFITSAVLFFRIWSNRNSFLVVIQLRHCDLRGYLCCEFNPTVFLKHEMIL